ncbi:MAG: hypothetical protein ACOY4R_27810 [Pseudomonadota bacterium]
MGNYTSTFGGQTINPAQLSYAAFTIDADLVLVWPLEAVEGADVAAAKIDVTATTSGLSVYVPAADKATVGQDILIRNTGANTFAVLDADGGTIGAVASGQAWYFYVTNNATAAGGWDSVPFGVGTSSASAASLAGAGLRARVTLLDQNLPTTPLLNDYSVTSADRATVLMNNAGAVTYDFDDAVVLGNGFMVYVINAGSGSLVLEAYSGQTIDDASTKTLSPDESCVVFSDGANLHTLGYGRAISTTVTGTAINIAGSGTLNLSALQIAAQVQDYSGTLTGNRTIDFGGAVGYWFVYNNTAGAFTVTYRTSGLDAGVTVTQGAFSILRSNGTSMAIAFTATSGTVTSVGTTAGELTGGPITTTGTLGLANTSVTPGSYGSASNTLTATVDAKGRATAMAATPIAITASQVTDLQTILSALLPPGTGPIPYCGTTAPTGWVGAWGTIGSAASGATNRANADTEPLYTVFWNGWADAQAPVSGGRGASAAADFAANKTLTLPDMRGRLAGFLDNLSGSAAGRLTNTTMSPNGNTIGATGGAQTETASVSVSGSTAGSLSVSGTGLSDNPVTGGIGAAAGPGASYAPAAHQHVTPITGATSGNLSVSASGTTAAATNVQPTMLFYAIIKL